MLIINSTKKQLAFVHSRSSEYLPSGWDIFDYKATKLDFDTEYSIKRNYSDYTFVEISLEAPKAEVSFKVELTKQGYAALWERGGARGSSGEAQVITDKNGNPKKPLFVRQSGERSCGNHALIPVAVGDHIVSYYVVKTENNKDRCQVYKILAIHGETAVCQVVGEKLEGHWLPELPTELKSAVKVAKEKAWTFHCKWPMFIAK